MDTGVFTLKDLLLALQSEVGISSKLARQRIQETKVAGSPIVDITLEEFHFKIPAVFYLSPSPEAIQNKREPSRAISALMFFLSIPMRFFGRLGRGSPSRLPPAGAAPTPNIRLLVSSSELIGVETLKALEEVGYVDVVFRAKAAGATPLLKDIQIRLSASNRGYCVSPLAIASLKGH